MDLRREAAGSFRYAGMSDKLSSFGIYEINPLFDNHDQTSHLAAQMIWYFDQRLLMQERCCR